MYQLTITENLAGTESIIAQIADLRGLTLPESNLSLLPAMLFTSLYYMAQCMKPYFMHLSSVNGDEHTIQHSNPQTFSALILLQR